METPTDLSVSGRRLAAVRHEAGGDAVVLLCHGFRGERTGPNRTFVRTARLLAERGIDSLRFDQYGSGDSEGDFLDSRFDDWIRTIRVLTERERGAGRRVALLGQSMGGTAVICAAAVSAVDGVVAWVPDASVDPYRPDGSGFMEEGGQRVADAYWQQAHLADAPGALSRIDAPCRLVFAQDDPYVSVENREALVRRAKATDEVEMLVGHTHSGWTADQAAAEIDRTVGFLQRSLAR